MVYHSFNPSLKNGISYMRKKKRNIFLQILQSIREMCSIISDLSLQLEI